MSRAHVPGKHPGGRPSYVQKALAELAATLDWLEEQRSCGPALCVLAETYNRLSRAADAVAKIDQRSERRMR